MADLSNLPSRTTPLLPRTTTPSNPSTKHSRAPTLTETPFILPPHQRKKKKTPPLRPSAAYIFKGIHPLFRREVIKED